MKKLTAIFLLAATTTFLFAEGQAEEAEWPTKPLSLIVPFSAGGGTDRMARTISPFIEEEVGESLVVVNRPGAAGEVGMTAIANADPDGYTMGLLSFPENYSMAAYKDVSYDNEGFEYIASFTETPTMLLVGPDSPYETLEDFIEAATEKPGNLTVSESGDTHTMTVVLLEEAADISVTTVNYDGAGENLNAVLGGHVDASSIALLFADTALEQGARILAIAGSKRVEKFPDVPTFGELGYDIRMTSSRVICVPSGTPQPVIETLTSAIDRVGTSEELREAISRGGEVYAYRSGEELDEYVADSRDSVVRIATEYKDKLVR